MNEKVSRPDDPVPKQMAFGRVEAARILGVSPHTIDRLRKRGLLKCSLATRRPLYPRWELERFLKETTFDLTE